MSVILPSVTLAFPSVTVVPMTRMAVGSGQLGAVRGFEKVAGELPVRGCVRGRGGPRPPAVADGRVQPALPGLANRIVGQYWRRQHGRRIVEPPSRREHGARESKGRRSRIARNN